MFLTIIMAITTFVATGIDEIFILTLLFTTQAQTKRDISQIYIGQLVGMIVLLGISTLAVFGISLFSQKWVSLLGLIPIVIGLYIWIKGENDDDENEVIAKSKLSHSLLLTVAAIAIAGGAEELAIYIPFFAALDATELIVTWLIFILLVPVWCTLSRKLASYKHLKEPLEKYERVIVPFVFIGLGVFVLFENF